MSLQYGVPLEDYVRKFSHMRFEPQGHTKNPDIRIAKSLIDYIFRWLGITFLPGYKEASMGQPVDAGPAAPSKPSAPTQDDVGETKPAATKAGGQESANGKSNGQEAKALYQLNGKINDQESNGHSTNGHATNGHSTNGHSTKRSFDQRPCYQWSSD